TQKVQQSTQETSVMISQCMQSLDRWTDINGIMTSLFKREGQDANTPWTVNITPIDFTHIPDLDNLQQAIHKTADTFFTALFGVKTPTSKDAQPLTMYDKWRNEYWRCRSALLELKKWARNYSPSDNTQPQSTTPLAAHLFAIPYLRKKFITEV